MQDFLQGQILAFHMYFFFFLMNEEIIHIKKDVEEFLLKNQVKYDIYTFFQEHLNNINDESFPQIIEFIKENSKIFFKDHSTGVFFFYFLFQYSQSYFQKLEIILEICLHFKSEMNPLNITERELLSICMYFPNGINYLFNRNFFTIESIIEQSTSSKLLFINFLPEIENHDIEYAKLREKDLFPNPNDPQLQREIKFYKEVKLDRNKHILNRNENYHPLPLHKSIRNDDIDMFQFLLSSNNYGINYEIEYSHYERAKMIDENLSLIQVAAVYGSIKIFKFLWMQEGIVLNHNLLSYAYYGCNFEIIHLCEQKCSHEKVYIQPIVLYRNDLLDYYLENFGNKIEENDVEVKNKLSNLVDNDDDDNLYKYLNYESLLNALFAFNLHVIKPCLVKIVYIVKNVEFNNDWNYSRNESFLKFCEYEIDLFKFLYSQKNIDVDVLKCPCFFDSLISCLDDEANDAFLFLFYDLNKGINFKFVFLDSIETNHDMTIFLLDLQLKEKESNDKNNDSLFHFLYKDIIFDDLSWALKFYNEEIIIKMIKLYDYILTNENVPEFVSKLISYISQKMICSFITNLSSFLQIELLNCMIDVFEKNGCLLASNIIKNKISKNTSS